MKNKKKVVLYQKVFESLKKAIIEEDYPLGTLIPTENELVELFSVSKITVRQAVQLLVDEGYVEKQSGYGTTVINNRPFNTLSNVMSYSKILENEGAVVTKEILSIERVPNPFDFSFVHRYVFKMVRIYKIDGVNSFYYVHYFSLPKNRDLKIPKEENFSLYSYFAKQKMPITYIEDSFEASKASKEVANLLQPKDNIVLKRTRKSFAENERVVEYTESYYSGNAYPYMINYEV